MQPLTSSEVKGLRKKAISMVLKVKNFVLDLRDNPVFIHQINLMYVGQSAILRSSDLSVARA